MSFHAIANVFSRAEIFFYALLWLMVLLVAGTIAQVSMGLYAAQQIYFSSFFLWVGPIPLPGGYLILSVIFVNLLAKLIFKSPWTKARFGINIIHLGAILLLFGGGLTAALSQEGAMVLAEGERTNIVSDYHRFELAIGKVVFGHDQLTRNHSLSHPVLPFTIEPLRFCENSHIVKRSMPVADEYHGFAKIFELTCVPRSPEERENRAGFVFRVRGAAKGIDGIYAVFESMPIEQTVSTEDQRIVVTLRRAQTALPFQIELIDFEEKLHPRTDLAQSYKSVVMLIDGEVRERKVIEMNRPLRYQNYTLYQASFLKGLPVETTVLAVVHNVGRIFPYLSSLIMCFGLLLHLFLQVPAMLQKRAQEPLKKAHLRRCPRRLSLRRTITYASVGLLGLPRIWTFLRGSKKRSFQKVLKSVVLLSMLLLPPFFLDAAEMRDSVQLTAEQPILHEGRIKPLDTFARVELLAIHGKRSLPDLSALAWLEELLFEQEVAYKREVFNIRNPEVVDMLGLQWRLEHLYSFEEISKGFQNAIATVEQLHLKPKEERTPAQHQFVDLSLSMVHYYALSRAFLDGMNGAPSEVLPLLPLSWREPGGELKVTPWKLKLEVFSNRVDLIPKSLALYIATLLLLLASWLVWSRKLRVAAMLTLCIGGALHVTGILMRIVILARPPVSTLYESILFVAFIAVSFGIILELVRRNQVGMLIGSIIGSALLFVSLGYAAEGDTLGQLVAVLNTNFWLATHVVTITIGYGSCLVGGVMGHLYLLQRLLNPAAQEKHRELGRNMVGVAAVALFFALFGTILGGIWADQSWGRFWGWDPKENGALLIVLWLLWLLHGRITGQIKELGFAFGMVITNILVALAWFGVNLLNVGLHSYGFTDNIALNLSLFCGFELLFGIATYAILRRKKI